MELILETPVKLFLNGTDQEISSVRSILKYKDKAVERSLRQLKVNPYYRMRYGDEWLQKSMDELQKELWKVVVYQDADGRHYTLPGLRKRIEGMMKCSFKSMVSYPEFQMLPWNKIPSVEMRYYQKESVDRLLSNPHSHIELGTGAGKSLVIQHLIKATGLPTVVATPSASIARQLYEEALEFFGKKNVGLFGDGKKEIGKKILICVGKSLSMVKEPEQLEEFKKYQVFISDESHQLAADIFNYFTNTVLGHCQYRWFVSATQERNDGKDLILEGNIGPRVYEKGIRELQEEGYLAKISTMIFDIDSDDDYSNSNNVVKMNQKHLYQNQKIAQIVADLSSQAVNRGMPTLILIDEHAQEEILKNYMKVAYEYAHGGSDVGQICKDFNDGRIMCVIGTSAVSTGTNFLPVRLTINWQANRAGTKVKQGPIGRSTRIHKASGKTEAKIVDFRIRNVPMLARHANDRIRYYKEVGPVSFVECD